MLSRQRCPVSTIVLQNSLYSKSKLIKITTNFMCRSCCNLAIYCTLISGTPSLRLLILRHQRPHPTDKLLQRISLLTPPRPRNMLHHLIHPVMPLHDLRLVRQRPQPPLLQLHLPIPFPLRLLPRGGRRIQTVGFRQSLLVDVAVILVLPLSHVRNETQLSRPLDQFGYLTLIFGAQSTLHSIHDLPPGGGVPSQQGQIVLMQESFRNELGVSSIHLSGGIQIGGE
mmetsp:Transcript_2210/g.4292  ORF Transcript_2210/g.4292 Transcript_2210/m.4292 type:complete len:226 (-) Transcript_2210:696-1373(-)